MSTQIASQKEILQAAEQKAVKKTGEKIVPHLETITVEQIELLCSSRVAELNSLESFLSKDFMAAIAEKLRQERLQFSAIIKAKEKISRAREKYSFVLDPAYFQQRFFINNS